LDGGSARCKTSTYIVQHYTEKREHISKPRAGLKTAIPVFDRSKIVRASDAQPLGPVVVVVVVVVVVNFTELSKTK
jgi:hypothetical protein